MTLEMVVSACMYRSHVRLSVPVVRALTCSKRAHAFINGPGPCMSRSHVYQITNNTNVIGPNMYQNYAHLHALRVRTRTKAASAYVYRNYMYLRVTMVRVLRVQRSHAVALVMSLCASGAPSYKDRRLSYTEVCHEDMHAHCAISIDTCHARKHVLSFPRARICVLMGGAGARFTRDRFAANVELGHGGS